MSPTVTRLHPAVRTRPRVVRAKSPNGRPKAPPPKERVTQAPFIGVDEAVRRIGQGRMVIVVDDADRENEGDLVFAAQKSSPALVNFAVKHGRGILCAAMAPEIAERLDLKLLVSNNTSKFGTPFTEPAMAISGRV